MSDLSEDEVKKRLQIDSWGNLSKAKMLKFVAMMPQLDKEVAIKIVEQFPEFSKFGSAALNALKHAQDSILKADDESRADLHTSVVATRATLQGQLERDDLTFDERKFFVENVMSVLRLEAEKDSERKRFLLDVLTRVGIGVGIVAATAVVALGGRLGLDSHGEAAGTHDV